MGLAFLNDLFYIYIKVTEKNQAECGLPARVVIRAVF